MTFDVHAGGFRFEWSPSGQSKQVAVGLLDPLPADIAFYDVLRWEFASDELVGGEHGRDHCNVWPASVHALLKRIPQHRDIPFTPGRGVRFDQEVIWFTDPARARR